LCLLIATVATLFTAPAAPTASAQALSGKDSPFGINASLGNRVRTAEHAAMVELMREAGVQWSREELSWDRMQLERGGPFRWEGDAEGLYNYDNAIAVQRAAGINVLGILAYNPAWFKSKNPKLDEWLGDWGNYVYNVVARYGRERNQIRYWEVWNEANLRPFGYEHGLYTIKDFVRLLDVSRAAIKAADPQAVIVLGGLADIYGQITRAEEYDSLDYLRMLHAAGGWNSFDILGWHPYRGLAPETVQERRGVGMSMEQEFRILDGMMAAWGPKPIWLTEMGWSSATPTTRLSEADQAAYLQRMYVIALAHPSIQKIFWYDLRDDTAPGAPYERPVFNQHEPEFHFGLLRRRFPLDPNAADLRKPAFLAYRALANSLRGLRFAAVIANGAPPNLPDIHWYRFSDGQRHVNIVWRTGGGRIEVNYTCNCPEVRVRGWDARLTKVTQTTRGQAMGLLEELGTLLFLEEGPDPVKSGRFFEQTGHYVRDAFERYWLEGGGLAQFGYPITGELIEPDPATGKARVVQYFERNRFDYFPDLADTPYVIQLGHLGGVALRSRGVKPDTLPRREAGDPPCLFFAETGHQICPPFRERWEQSGGLPRHGLPLTDAFDEQGRVVQYFERSRFESHPNNPPDFQVQLGLLGRELYASWGRWR
jgi:hypothetical protein